MNMLNYMLADMESLVVHVQEKKVSLIRRASVSCEGKAARKVPAAYSNLSLKFSRIVRFSSHSWLQV